MKNSKGITLIALVITIIVLLILAGVSISLTLGNNGVLNQATNAVTKSKNASAKEDVEMAWASATSEYWSDWASNSGANKEDYFTASKLTTYTGGENGTGTVTTVEPNGDGTYVVYYTSNDQNKDYIFLMSEDGENISEINGMPDITELEGMYGTTVSGYTGYTATDVSEWKLLYVDEKYKEAFLISSNEIVCTADTVKTISETGISYTGSNNVVASEYGKRYNGLWLNKCTTERTANDAKGTAYMCDPLNWERYKGNKAKYAVGGPTSEIIVASFYAEQVSDFAKSDYNGNAKTNLVDKVRSDGYGDVVGRSSGVLNSKQYIMPTSTNGYKLSSPYGMGNNNYLEVVRSDGFINAVDYNAGNWSGVRPTVCLAIYALEIVDNGGTKTLKIAD